MDRAYDTYVEKKMQTSCWCIKPKEDHVHCLSADGSTTLRWVLEMQDDDLYRVAQKMYTLFTYQYL